MIKKLMILCLFVTVSGSLWGQGGYYFGVKGGLSVGIQNWNNFEQDPLFKYHGDLFIESYTDAALVLFAQLGYHVKGSALRNRLYFNPVNGLNQAPAKEFLFNNASLVLGAKQKFDWGSDSKYYYSMGLRADYTLSTNLSEYSAYNAQYPGYYPFDNSTYIRSFMYGISFGGGAEFTLSDYFGITVDLTVNPDLSFQYIQPSFPTSVRNPYTGQYITIQERKIRNITIELSVGLRFLREIEYID